MSTVVSSTSRGTALRLKACGWCGAASVVLLLIGFVGLAGFLPPPSPLNSAEQTAHIFAANANAIRSGMIVTMVAAVLLGPFTAAITVQMRRIEGRHSALAWVQMGLGMLFVLEFIYLVFFWQVAAFRPDRAAAQMQLLNDMAWLPFVGITGTLVVQIACFGIIALSDRRTHTIFPRWFGYYQLWVALMVTPGTFCVFFKSGPLAWNGLLAFYIPVTIFASWLIVTPIFLSRAVDHQLVEESDDPLDHARNADASLVAEVAELRAVVGQLSSRLEDMSDAR